VSSKNNTFDPVLTQNGKADEFTRKSEEKYVRRRRAKTKTQLRKQQRQRKTEKNYA
jgi:hypothetical protein|tara:strand:- start:524 stop:691 length:168 start_codon:yes stop_codon:yes gene_type:complete